MIRETDNRDLTVMADYQQDRIRAMSKRIKELEFENEQLTMFLMSKWKLIQEGD